jgi:hypothetical protein
MLLFDEGHERASRHGAEEGDDAIRIIRVRGAPENREGFDRE